MLDHSVVFDPDDPHCPVCGSKDVEESESEMYETVWTCESCENWARQSDYKGETPL